MYSLILMTAMSGAPEAPQFNGFFRNLFSFNGCRGSSEYGSCHGCYGSGVSRSVGCYGSCSGFGSRLRAFFNRGSCYGSCTGSSYACYGSGSGYASCHGSSFSCGGGYGLPPTDYGMPPADGFAPTGPAVPYAPPAAAVPSAYLPAQTGSCGCGDGYTLGTPVPVADPYAAPFASTPPPTPMPAAPPASVPEDRNARRVALAAPDRADRARGTVVVRLPADAKLYAEGRPLTLTSGERTFVTPALPGGQDYTYTFRAEYVRDGETISQTRRVAVRPGHSATVEFADLALAKRTAKPDPVVRPTSVKAEPVSKPSNPFIGRPAAPSATERARITVKLPPGAALYVDGKKNDRTELVREFSTPALAPGREYAYLRKAEVLRDGRPESQLTKVTFRAGEIVTVDFTAAPGR